MINRRRIKHILLVILWISFVTYIFVKYAEKIEEFNVKLRTAVIGGNFSARVFDGNCIPHSYSRYAEGSDFISPFYVVHYGMIYSDSLAPKTHDSIWKSSDSVKNWDIPPKEIESQCFKNSVDWILRNLREFSGKFHLLYEFDWKYEGYPNGGLSSPWWSGLTDGYAIILLLRAYDFFKDESYLVAAAKLYESALTPVDNGGSKIQWDGDDWIEEYVDPRARAEGFPRVLNGMIYATYGIDAYEQYMKIKQPTAPALYQAIANKISIFARGKWSNYDAIGTPANIKYHAIHVALADELYSKTGNLRFERQAKEWKAGAEFPGLYWVLNGRFSPALLQFVIQYVLIICIPFLLFLIRKNIFRN
jgi:hypothetical protein